VSTWISVDRSGSPSMYFCQGSDPGIGGNLALGHTFDLDGLFERWDPSPVNHFVDLVTIDPDHPTERRLRAAHAFEVSDQSKPAFVVFVCCHSGNNYQDRDGLANRAEVAEEMGRLVARLSRALITGDNR